MAPVVREALNRALWNTKAGAAWGAAVYLMDRGESSNPGVPRGIVFGGVLHYDYRAEAEPRLAALLADPKSRNLALDALGAGLYGEYRGARFHSASLLVRLGAQFNDRIVIEIAGAARHWPVASLCLLALLGRASQARETAKRLDLSHLVELIGDESIVLDSGSPMPA